MSGPRLAERVFLVTGAAGGIGAGVTRAILEERGRVALADLDLDRAERVAAMVDPDGSSTCAFQGDVSSVEDVAAVVRGTLDRFERLDGAVNNAGAVTLDEAWDATAADWKHQLDVNVTGSFLVAKAVGMHLKTTGGGSIVNVSSNCGKVGYRNMAAYNASKAAVIGLTRSLSMEWAEHGINVNAVCPGGVDTPMLRGVAEWLSPRLDIPADELLSGMGPAQLARRVSPLEVGRVIAFLLSDDALIIRGQAINVDGGDTPY
ncbi:MAG: SDR family NAD(P)-dependent oxidoreductase [bacterium]|nr:SDR family NAD(P)-dependent oxidoreductase [bacterium]MDE0289072.1 SDR family NAD(P)-dependent oxidoreductase [bacterium]MDE0439378.1 SDR family NAD(P)-dependent oxidoreductase [bacterium]